MQWYSSHLNTSNVVQYIYIYIQWCGAAPNSMLCNAMQYIQMQCSTFKNNAIPQYIQCSCAAPTSIHPMVWCCSNLNVMMQYIQMQCSTFTNPMQWCSHLNVDRKIHLLFLSSRTKCTHQLFNSSKMQ